MCLAIPGKLVEIHDENGLRMGKVEFGGIFKRVCLEYVPDAQPGDYLIVHVGFALQTIDETEARRVFAYLEEMNQLDELQAPAHEIPR